MSRQAAGDEEIDEIRNEVNERDGTSDTYIYPNTVFDLPFHCIHVCRR